ncbi:MAG TPA: sigma 54-interacting transcriptional regulator [Kofleriaceae bacterium]|nr:sigma 54-interacting transcriptional regulator [Kofleriaceae bacterium]
MGNNDEDDTTASPVAAPSDEDSELCALVSIDGVVTTHVLPHFGMIDIGRGSNCDIVIEHPSVSRHHATLQVKPLVITDAQSRNGTRVRGNSLAPGISVRLEIGEAIQLGQATVLIHHKRLVEETPGLATARTVDALLRQLEIECARSARSGSPFAYVRVQMERGEISYEQLRATMRMTDVVADDHGSFQLLLPDTPSDQVAGAIARITGLLGQRNAEARIGVARYPYDGTTAEALVARVWEQLEGPQVRSATEMDAVRALIAQVAVSDVSVLIYGETGVGKELCAEMLHRQSRRSNKPFVKLNCSTISESLIESELFGHERGAFTGATAATQGLLEAGDGGTVFLDEIGELPLPAQAKLLRVLEERVVRRVGSTVGRTLDIRFIGATNRMLPEEIDAGRFRRDLYYRINGVTVTIPPLRERQGEIAGLARAFAAKPRTNSVPTDLEDDALAALQRHQWPGNVRELRNTIERAVLFAAGGPIKAEHLTLQEAQPPRRSSGVTIPIERLSSSDITTLDDSRFGDGRSSDSRLADSIAEVERRRILDALERCGGNQTRAARMLGISRNTLLSRLDAYGLPRPRKT